jgi:hypothetical protein
MAAPVKMLEERIALLEAKMADMAVIVGSLIEHVCGPGELPPIGDGLSWVTEPFDDGTVSSWDMPSERPAVARVAELERMVNSLAQSTHAGERAQEDGRAVWDTKAGWVWEYDDDAS